MGRHIAEYLHLSGGGRRRPIKHRSARSGRPRRCPLPAELCAPAAVSPFAIMGSGVPLRDRCSGIDECTWRVVGWQAVCVILPSVRDTRLVTFRRGGTLTNADHQLLALWAAACAEHVLHLFEEQVPADRRPRQAIEAARAWADGRMKMMQARAVGGHAMGAARPLRGAARFAAYAAGQAACVGHVPEHHLGAAAYAIKAVRVADSTSADAGRIEREWQRRQLPDQIRDLVLEDQVRRNDICWSAFVD